MKHFIILYMLLQVWTLSAQFSSDWQGQYSGLVVERAAILHAETNGDQWTATIDIGGYLIDLKGTIDGSMCKGIANDPQTKSAVPFEAIKTKGRIVLTIIDEDPATGVEQKYDLTFDALNTSSGEDVNKETVVPVIVDPSSLDQQLTGQWRYTSTYMSGEFTVATDYFISFESNGIVKYTDGRTAGGNMSGSFDSGSSDVHQAIWKAENKDLYFDYGDGWQLHAHYAVDENNMLFTLQNGNKQIWERF
ncbi:MAG: hypothetical protein WBP41_02940 [Saprospiraceae bacterium]